MGLFFPTAKQFSPVIFFKPLVPARKGSKRKSDHEQDDWAMLKAPALAEFYKHSGRPKAEGSSCTFY